MADKLSLMAQTLIKPVEKNALVELASSLDNFNAKRTMSLNRQKHPDTCLPKSAHDALDQYYGAFDRVRSAVAKALPSILQTARTSSPYYGYPPEILEKAYRDFMKQDRKIRVEYSDRYVPSFVLKVPNSDYCILLSNAGEAGPNLVDEKKKVHLTAVFEEIEPKTKRK